MMFFGIIGCIVLGYHIGYQIGFNRARAEISAYIDFLIDKDKQEDFKDVE